MFSSGTFKHTYGSAASNPIIKADAELKRTQKAIQEEKRCTEAKIEARYVADMEAAEALFYSTAAANLPRYIAAREAAHTAEQEGYDASCKVFRAACRSASAVWLAAYDAANDLDRAAYDAFLEARERNIPVREAMNVADATYSQAALDLAAWKHADSRRKAAFHRFKDLFDQTLVTGEMVGGGSDEDVCQGVF